MNLEITSPLDGKILDQVSLTSTSKIDAEINEAKEAQKKWDDIGIKNRAKIFYRYQNILSKNSKDLAELIHRENGKTIEEATAEVEKAIEVTEFACSMPQLMVNESLEVSRGVECSLSYRPLGVVASITPFNFPVMIPHWTMPIALMAGNAMLVKPSELVPLSTLRSAELAYEAGVPKEILKIIIGKKEAVETLCEHEEIKAVSFVGSTQVAKKVYQKATSNLKRALCLGGAKNHLLVLPDADPEMTALNVVASMSGMAGQRCMAASVMVAVGDVDHIISKVVEKAKSVVPGKNLGAIISKTAKDRIENYIDKAETMGAELRLDGRGAKVLNKESGNYVAPTVIDNVDPNSSLAQDEIFGPVLSIIRSDSVDEAIRIQNKNTYGNGASVYTNSGALAKYVKERLTAGMIGINIGVPVPREPFSFGGIKESKFGVGDITGKSSINFWTNLVKHTTKWNKEAGINWMS